MESSIKRQHRLVHSGTVKVKEVPKRFMRMSEAAEYYSIGLTKFRTLLRESGAMYKIDGMILVNIDKFDEYLETFRVPEGRHE